MVAPLVAAALSTLGPILAKHGAELLGRVFEVGSAAAQKKATELIAARTGISLDEIAADALTPEQSERLRELQNEHYHQILDWLTAHDAQDTERARIAGADRASARTMQSATSGALRWFVPAYSALITLATFAFVFWACFFADYTNRPEALRLVDTVLGFLLGVTLSAIIQFYFGSSSGSQDKSSQIERLTQELTRGSRG